MVYSSLFAAVMSPNRVVSACFLSAQCIEENLISAVARAKFSEQYH